MRLDTEDPRPPVAVLDTGAGPSVLREDVLPEGWRDKAARTPPKTHVCDASGQLLKAPGRVEVSVIVEGRGHVA